MSVYAVLACEESISCAWAFEPCWVGMAMPSCSPYLAVNIVMQTVAVPDNVKWVHLPCQAAKVG